MAASAGECADTGVGFRGGFALGPVSGGASHTAVNMSGDNAEATLDQLEEDEDEMRRANSEVLQMQRRMLDGKPPLPPLPWPFPPC